MVLIFGLAFRQRAAKDDDRSGRWFGRLRLDHALSRRERRRTANPEQRQHIRLARNVLQHHQLDAGRLDSAQQRRPLHGRRGLLRYGPFDQYFLSTAAKHLDLRADGDVYLNRSLANWPRRMFRQPYTQDLTEILGPPIAPEEMWNPDAVLRVQDIHHRPNTQERLDKAAATQT